MMLIFQSAKGNIIYLAILDIDCPGKSSPHKYIGIQFDSV